MSSPFPRVRLVRAALVVALAVIAPAAAAGQSATPAPAPRVWLPVDAFYTPPPTVPAHPGVVLRQEPLTDPMAR